MAGRRTFIVIGTGSSGSGPVHCRVWEVSPGELALERLAGTLTAAYGEPAE